MNDPIAYFLTWRTYGTWLHGDARGSVDREHNVYDTPILQPNDERENKEKERLRHAEVELNPDQRSLVADAITEHSLWREWPLIALAVQSNHVHVVVGQAGIAPERVMAQFKAWSTRKLREHHQADRETKIWGHHGSTRYIWNEQQLRDAVTYVQDGQNIRR